MDTERNVLLCWGYCVFKNGAWEVTAAGLRSAGAWLRHGLYIPAADLLEMSDGAYAWPMRLSSLLGSSDFELFVDAFRAAVSKHHATAADPALLQRTIEAARRCYNEPAARLIHRDRS
jgi:hypothetical protein